MRIAVTGASGFCGGEVARAAAAAGHDVVCLGRRPGPVGEHRPWDATRGAPDLAGADAVVHLAAAVGDSRREAGFRAVNVDGAVRLLDAAAGVPVVWVSTASVYDPRLDRGRVTEAHPFGGQLGAYGRTKAEGDRLALAAGAVVLRPHAVYGPGDPHLLPRLRRAVRADRALLPGPDVRLSVTAVENLAGACLAAIGWAAGAYNVADAEPASRDDLVSRALGVRILHVPVAAALAVARLAALRPEPLLTPYAVDQLSHDFVLDTAKAAATGWRPERTVSDWLATIG